MVDDSDLEEQCYSAHVETVEGLLTAISRQAVTRGWSESAGR